METDFAAAVFLGRCPHCGEGPLFDGWLAIHPTCSVCGARYERWEGAAHGAVAFGYGVGAAVAALATVVMWARGWLVEGAEYKIAAVAVISVLLTYRPVKAWWIAMLDSMGYVFPDPPAPSVGPGAPPSAG
jgi:uncharacterized protein (DUF983 family)